MDTFEEINIIFSDFLNSNRLCTQPMLDAISRINPNIFLKMLELFTNQKEVHKDADFCLYQSNILSYETKHHIDISCDIKNMFNTTIQSDGINILLHTLSIQSMINFILDNNDGRKYLFLPLTFEHEKKSSGHMSAIIIDLEMHMFYLFDPNGRTTYFNNIYTTLGLGDGIIDTNLYIDMLFIKYVSDFNICAKNILGFEFDYVSSCTWNPSCATFDMNISYKHINRTIEKSEIGSGHCVILTVMLCHYFAVTRKSVANGYNDFAVLSDDQLLSIINSYTIYCFDLASSISKNICYNILM